MKRHAYSLVFVLIYMVIIMLIASSSIQDVEKKIIFYRDISAPIQAFGNARSSFEEGVQAIKGMELGYEPVDPNHPDQNGTCSPENLVDLGDNCGRFQIFARAQKNNSNSSDLKYYTPMPNTGTAWDEDFCQASIQKHKTADHPCNWNKIMYGQSVSIPLYFSWNGTATDDGIVTPFQGTSNPANWYLRVRTPCKPSSTTGKIPDTCLDADRYVLDEGDRSLDQDKSVILWTLIGEDASGNEEQLFVDTSKRIDSITRKQVRNEALNTEIYEGLINAKRTGNCDSLAYVVLSTLTTCGVSNSFVSVRDFTKETMAPLFTDYKKLSLRIEVVYSLLASSTTNVPYLEWQLVSTTVPGQAPAADQIMIFGQGYDKGQKGVYYHPYRKKWSVTNELFPNYTLAN